MVCAPIVSEQRRGQTRYVQSHVPSQLPRWYQPNLSSANLFPAPQSVPAASAESQCILVEAIAPPMHCPRSRGGTTINRIGPARVGQHDGGQIVTARTTARRGLQIFSRNKPVVGQQQMRRPPVWDQPAVDATPEFFAAGGSAEGVLFRRSGRHRGERARLIWLRLGADYHLPRHSHRRDCLYYITAGEIRLGQPDPERRRRFLRPGRCTLYVYRRPAGARFSSSEARHIRVRRRSWKRTGAGFCKPAGPTATVGRMNCSPGRNGCRRPTRFRTRRRAGIRRASPSPADRPESPPAHDLASLP